MISTGSRRRFRRGFRIPLISICVLASAAASGAATQEQVNEIMSAYRKSIELVNGGDIAQALEQTQKAYELGREYLGTGSGDAALLALNHGQLLATAGDFEAARVVLADAVQLYEGVYGADAAQMINPLMVYAQVAPVSQQMPIAERALRLHEQYAPDDDMARANLAMTIAEAVTPQRYGNPTLAPWLEQALDTYRDNFGRNAVETIPVLMQLGHASASSEGTRDQMRHYNAALRIAEDELGRQAYADLVHEVGFNLFALAGSTEGADYLQEAREIFVAERGSTDMKAGEAAFNIGSIRFTVRDYAGAEQPLRDAVAIFAANSGTEEQVARTHGLLVHVYEQLAQRDKATEHVLALGRMSAWDEGGEYLPVYAAAPNAPIEVLVEGVTGWVDIELTVDELGMVQNPQIVNMEGPESFREPALAAVGTYRYAPRFVDGRAVPTTGVIARVEFKPPPPGTGFGRGGMGRGGFGGGGFGGGGFGGGGFGGRR